MQRFFNFLCLQLNLHITVNNAGRDWSKPKCKSHHTSYSHKTCNVIASWTDRCSASFIAWHVYTIPFICSVMFNFNSILETFPPCKPAFDVFDSPGTGIPSFHQDSFAGGLLELESQIRVASSFGFKSAGSLRIFTCSGATKRTETVLECGVGVKQHTYSTLSWLLFRRGGFPLLNLLLRICIWLHCLWRWLECWFLLLLIFLWSLQLSVSAKNHKTNLVAGLVCRKSEKLPFCHFCTK